jgi:5-methylcytosine-specific restriction endonuclease McrA
MKQCSKCGDTKPLTEFHKGKSKCKPCRRAERQTIREEQRDKLNARQRELYYDNHTRYREYDRGLHRRACKAECKHARRFGGRGSDIKELQMFYIRARMTSEATGVPHEVDHVVPVWKGGKHDVDNLQILSKDAHRVKTTQELAERYA